MSPFYIKGKVILFVMKDKNVLKTIPSQSIAINVDYQFYLKTECGIQNIEYHIRFDVLHAYVKVL